VSLKHRVRRIEDRLGAAVKADREQLAYPDIILQFVTTLLDAEGKNVYGGQVREYDSASVEFDGRIANYNRDPGESYSDFVARAMASTPSGRFARTFTPQRESHGR
jgi:hypothetical protein